MPGASASGIFLFGKPQVTRSYNPAAMAKEVPLHTWVVLITTLMGMGGGAVRYWQRRGSDIWPVTEGTVYDATLVGTDDAGRRIPLHVRVQYSYIVAGEFYSGEFLKPFDTESRAEEYASLYPRGLKIIVRARSEKPEISTMREDDNAALIEQAKAMSSHS